MAAHENDTPISKQRLANRLAVGWCVNSLAYSIVYPFIPVYLHVNRGMPMSKVGLIFPVMGLGAMVLQPVAGWLVDRMGRRRIMVAGPGIRGGVFFALATLAALNAPFYAFVIALFFTAGIGTFFMNAADAYITDISTTEERPEMYGKMRVGTNIGWMLGPAIGAFLARTPFSLLFGLTGVLCLGAAFFNFSNFPELSVRENRTEKENTGAGLREVIKHRRFVLYGLCSFILFLLVSQLYSTMSVYSTQTVGISKNELGFLYSINGLVIILLQIPSNRLFRNVRLGSRMALGGLLYCAGYFSLAYGQAWLHLVGSMVVLTCGELLVIPSLTALVSEMSPPRLVGRFMGAFGLMRGLGYAIGPWIGALLFEKYSDSPTALWGSLVAFGLTAVLGFVILDVFYSRVRRETGNR